MTDVVDPVRIDSERVRPAEKVISRVSRGRLIHILRVFRNVLKIAAPLVISVGLGIEGMIVKPGPGRIASFPVVLSIAFPQADQLIEQTQRGSDDAAVFFARQDFSCLPIHTERPGSVIVIPGTNVLG